MQYISERTENTQHDMNKINLKKSKFEKGNPLR